MTTENDEHIVAEEFKREIDAAGYYRKDLKHIKDKKLRKILKHNMKDELEDHAKKLNKFALEEEKKERKRI